MTRDNIIKRRKQEKETKKAEGTKVEEKLKRK
jgi:hypothetical protein